LSRPRSLPPPKPATLAKYVALLRGINVGGRIVKMDELRRAFEAMGFSNVETFIASGNVIFDAAERNAEALEAVVEAGLERTFGYPVMTFLRTPEEMTAAARLAPFGGEDLTGANVYVNFAKAPPDRAARAKVLALATELDAFAVNGREIYWLRRKVKERLGEPFPPLERALGVKTTNRNLTTVTKLAAKYCGARSDADRPKGRAPGTTRTTRTKRTK
jgi:uncharacterized protein (DUF1697 family)